MKKYILLLFLLFCCTPYLRAQNKPVNDGLKIGDKVPAVIISHILNYSSPSAKLSAFKGKLLILDFWATWCSGCIQNFPKMEALQKTFGSKIQVLAVTYQDSKIIKAFLAAKTDVNGNRYHFPTAVDDVALTKLFPHRFIPHCVWIGPDGRVVAITGADDVNGANIAKVLQRRSAVLPPKIDLDAKKPLFLLGNVTLDSLSYYAIFLKGHYSGLGSGTHLREKDKVVYGLTFTNSHLIDMYTVAAFPLFDKRNDRYSPKRLLLNVKDTSKVLLTKGPDGYWSAKEEYNCDIIVPFRLADSLYDFMLDNLNRYGDYTATIEKREMTCLVLTKNGDADKLKTRGGPPVNTMFFMRPAVLRNCPLKYLADRLNERRQVPYPVIDETNYTGNVDITLSGDLDMTTLQKELAVYGLQLQVAERRINMLVITDK
jgi:thiol-disulfide isomerase/thioredoxin